MPINSDYFNLATLTESINLLPTVYGKINTAGIFRDKGITTRTAVIEEKNGILKVLGSKALGAPGQEKQHGQRNVRTFSVPHIPLDDVILPDDYQGVRAFGSESDAYALATVMADRLQDMRNSHDLTREYMRLGALKGVIKDGDGNTIADLFSAFNITKKTVNFELDVDDTDVASKCREVIRHIEENLKGEVMNHVHAYVDSDFFDTLISHPNVEKFYVNWQGAAELAGRDPRSGFSFSGITFEEYNGTVTLMDDTTETLIASGYGHCFPFGTLQTFFCYNAPADFNETANTLGLPYYAKVEERKMNRGLDLHSQSNPLPLCVRPGVLVEITNT